MSLSVDQFFDKRIGLGRAQYISIMCLCLIDMNDGAQLVLSSFLNPIIKRQYNLTSGQVQNMSSVFYLGILIGSLLTGKFSDKYGRRPVIIGGSSLQFLACCCFGLVNSLTTIMLVRFLYGFTFGLTIALTTSMFSEIVPSQYRGKGLLFINFCVSLGKIFSISLAYIFLDDFTHGNWRMMMVCSSVPSLIVVYGAIFHMKESSRFLLASGKYEEAFEVMDYLLERNQKPSITPAEKTSLISWQTVTFANVQQASMMSIFQPKYLRTTLALCSCWFTLNFMYYGQLIILPFVFGKEAATFASYVYTILGEAPTLIVSFYMIDKPQFGRKKSQCIFFACAALLHLGFTIHPITFFSSASRFFMKECFQMLYPFTTQSFGTLNRTIGFGFCSAVGRAGATIMPYVLFPLLQISKTFVFVSFVVVSVLGCLASYLVPNDTLGAELDKQHQQKQGLAGQYAILLPERIPSP